MEIRNVFLLRVSSSVDKDVEHPQFFDPPYPLKYLQAGLSESKDTAVHLLDCWIHPMSLRSLLERISEARPDLIVLSATSFEMEVADALVKTLRTRPIKPLVVGIGQGFYLRSGSEECFDTGYDAVLLGEPEEEFFRLLRWIQKEDAAGREWREHYRRCFMERRRFVVEDLDRLPFPTYTPEELKEYKSIYPVRLSRRVVWGFLIATRGCPHRCTFCSEVMRVSIGRRLRAPSPERVADEMEHLGKLGVNICSFQDDSFSANRRFVRSLCEELIARGSKMAWMARVRVDEVDFEILELMKRAGCVMLGMGVESGSQRVVEGMHKQERPGPWPELCRRVFRWTAQLGIGTNAYYVIGNPSETREEIQQTMRLAMELDSDSIQVHYYTPYPGSAAWETHRDAIAPHDPGKMFHYATPLFSLAEVSVDELVALRSRFYSRYILRPRFAMRHLRTHLGFYLHNPDVFWKLLGIRKILLRNGSSRGEAGVNAGRLVPDHC